MNSRRLERVQDLVREEVSRLLLFKVKDPGFSSISVTRVKMTGDLKRAIVYYSIFDDTQDRREVQGRLEKATGFFRREVGQALGMKFVPELRFEFDRSLEYAQQIDQVFRKIHETAKDHHEN